LSEYRARKKSKKSWMRNNMKLCSRCKQYKAISDFGIDNNRKDGLNCYCKICVNEQSRPRSKNRPKRPYSKEKAKLVRDRRTQEQKDKVAFEKRKSWVKKSYGITMEEYYQMFNLQDGKCAICNRDQGSLSMTLGIDHNHITKEIRGLLCQVCNRMLGFLKVDETNHIVQNLIDYLSNAK
jgi:hypothetical protein